MKIALCQMKNEGSMEANLEKSIHAMEAAAANGADLILYPEVQLTEFFPQYPIAHYRETGFDPGQYEVSADSDIVKAFRRACRDNHIMAVPNIWLREDTEASRDTSPGRYEQHLQTSGAADGSRVRSDGVAEYDASLLIGRDGRIVGTQKMVHVAEAPQFHEQDYYTPSDEGFKVFDTESGRIGIVVCFDRHYPESIRTETLRGADLILIPTVNTKSEPMEMFEWEIRVQAFQNSVAIAMCNRVGMEGDMEFSGESLIVNANGGVICKADDTEQIVYAEIDLSDSRRIRESRPYTSLRRPEFYE